MKLVLENKKIKLRKLKVSDVVFIYRNIKDKELTRYTFIVPPPFTFKKSEEFIKKTHNEWREKRAYEFGIELKENKQLIGTITLFDINSKNKNAEVGIWIVKKYWGKGLSQESLSLILDFGFKRLKLERIQARVLHKNKPAQKLLEKMGLKLEGKLRRKTFFKNRWYDNLIYGILKEEWK